MNSQRCRARAAGVLALSLLSAAAVQGQPGYSDLRVRLEAESGIPLGGALVALLDQADRVVAEGLSSEDGRRTLRAADGVYRVRVRRIGFHPHAIEVYPRAGQASQSIVALRDGCGVILVWTRTWAEREIEREERRQAGRAPAETPRD